jgi:hypothetical protein
VFVSAGSALSPGYLTGGLLVMFISLQSVGWLLFSFRFVPNFLSKVDSRKIFEVTSHFRASGMNDILAMQQKTSEYCSY